MGSGGTLTYADDMVDDRSTVRKNVPTLSHHLTKAKFPHTHTTPSATSTGNGTPSFALLLRLAQLGGASKPIATTTNTCLRTALAAPDDSETLPDGKTLSHTARTSGLVSVLGGNQVHASQLHGSLPAPLKTVRFDAQSLTLHGHGQPSAIHDRRRTCMPPTTALPVQSRCTPTLPTSVHDRFKAFTPIPVTDPVVRPIGLRMACRHSSVDRNRRTRAMSAPAFNRIGVPCVRRVQQDSDASIAESTTRMLASRHLQAGMLLGAEAPIRATILRHAVCTEAAAALGTWTVQVTSCNTLYPLSVCGATKWPCSRVSGLPMASPPGLAHAWFPTHCATCDAILPATKSASTHATCTVCALRAPMVPASAVLTSQCVQGLDCDRWAWVRRESHAFATLWCADTCLFAVPMAWAVAERESCVRRAVLSRMSLGEVEIAAYLLRRAHVSFGCCFTTRNMAAVSALLKLGAQHRTSTNVPAVQIRLGTSPASLPTPPTIPSHVWPTVLYTPEPSVFRPVVYLGPPPDAKITALFTRRNGLHDRSHVTRVSIPALMPVDSVATTMSADALRQVLTGHPHQGMLVNAVMFGFPMLSVCPPRHADNANHPSVIEYGNLVDAWMTKDMTHHSLMDITNSVSPSTPVVISQLIAIPKSKEVPVCEIRLIFNMSSGDLSPNACSSCRPVEPIHLAKSTTLFTRFRYLWRSKAPGDRIMGAKIDISRAFRNIPLPLQDIWRSAFRVGNRVYASRVVNWGATTASHAMSALSSAICDVLHACGFHWESYSDDFMIIELASRIDLAVDALFAVLRAIRLPDNGDKWIKEGTPRARPIFLGIKFNLANGTVSVPEMRLVSILQLLHDVLDRDRTTPLAVHVVRSLAGKLTNIAALVPFARLFTRRLHILVGKLTGARKSHHVSLRHNDLVYNDLLWWSEALPFFNGSASLVAPMIPSTCEFATDASDTGFGGVCHNTRQYFMDTWTAGECALIQMDAQDVHHLSINARELAALVTATLLWASSRHGQASTAITDSVTAMICVNSRKPSAHRLIHLCSLLSLMQLKARFVVYAEHRLRHLNTEADDLSKGVVPPSLRLYKRIPIPSGFRDFGNWTPLPQQQPPNLALAPSPVRHFDTGSTSALSTVKSSRLPYPWRIVETVY